MASSTTRRSGRSSTGRSPVTALGDSSTAERSGGSSIRPSRATAPSSWSRTRPCWKLITGALDSGGADALVNSSALWSLIDKAIASDGAERMIHSSALWTLIGKALESENAEALVARLFESGLADQFIDRLLTSKAVWRLVDEIAASPAVTAAVTQQGLGFADQVLDELRARARLADDWILHKSRGDSNGDGTSPSGSEPTRSGAGDLQASPAVAPLIGLDTAVPGAPPADADTLVPAAPPDRRHLHPSRVGERC